MNNESTNQQIILFNESSERNRSTLSTLTSQTASVYWSTSTTTTTTTDSGHSRQWNSRPNQMIIQTQSINMSLDEIKYKILETNETESVPVEYSDLTQISSIRWMFLIAYLLVMISALFGNLIITYIVMTNRKMRTVVNYYIVNLAICDILISVFVLPTKVLELLAPAEWHLLNDTICTVMFFLQTVVVFASVLTLVATCFERYFAIVHPLKSRMQQSKKRTCRILLAVWTLSCIASAPNILTGPKAVSDVLKSDYGTINRLWCEPTFNDGFRVAYYTILFVCLYLIPLILIGFTCFCIARVLMHTSVLHRQGSLLRQEVNRRKIAKMILIVVLCFTISWTPYFLVSVVTQYQHENFLKHHDFYFTMLSINLFAFLHSSINPIVYLTMSARFQKGFLRILNMIFRCQQPPEHTGHSSIPEHGTSSPRCNNNYNSNHNDVPRKIVST